MTDTTTEHKRLANFVKGVHANLREQFQKNTDNISGIWSSHCKNVNMLKKYADVMHHLATDHWSKQPESRIQWCYDTVLDYYVNEGLLNELRRDNNKKVRRTKFKMRQNDAQFTEDAMNMFKTEIKLPILDKILLLDVGSCYHPFQQFEEILSVGIDISPATRSVYMCDFLDLEITKPLTADVAQTFIQSLESPIVQLPRELFHVVVFSLLLEYLPSPVQRWDCCVKAHALLSDDGLLLIVTPDSHQQHRNASIIKSWRLAIEKIGFQRWRYIKLKHIHCMAFRKILRTDSVQSTPDKLNIPQDFSDLSLTASELGYSESNSDRNKQCFEELPFMLFDEEKL